VTNPLSYGATVSDVRTCTDQLESALSQLQERYGIAAVLAALTEVAGCASCVGHTMKGDSLRALIERIERHRAGMPGS
jgi:hypothetical protein